LASGSGPRSPWCVVVFSSSAAGSWSPHFN